MAVMALCASCRTVSVFALTTKLEAVPEWPEQLNTCDRSWSHGMIHHRDARQLAVSVAAGCSLCILIRDSVILHDCTQDPDDTCTHHGSRDEAWSTGNLHDRLSNFPIYLRPNFDPLRRAFPRDDVPDALYVRGFRAYVPTRNRILVGQIRLFALEDSPAASSCNVVGRPQLPSSDSPEAYRLISRWITRCLHEHDNCKQTCSGTIIDESNPPKLPTRVIHVGHLNEGNSPRLFESEGKSGHYVALSHCWGPHKPPLMTTKSALNRHKTGIPWDELPKVYQDAITATHRLGYEWLWIDSLCILQDSRSDWLNESKRMGTIYENAQLTIAASHASDSSQPCFFPRLSPPASVEFPYITRTGEHEGSIYAAHMPVDYAPITPESSALDCRAWATQEWLLSRRMIFYTAESLVWSCKTISQRETGGSFHSTARNFRWKAIVEKYSARSLTQPGDRLVALEGLRIEMGKKRKNDTYCFGLWRFDMPEQLLWYSRQPAERDKSPLDLPSWTWASTMHGVRFIVMKKAKNGCGQIKFDEASQTLVVSGSLRKVRLISQDTLLSQSISAELSSFPPLADKLEHEIPSSMLCGIIMGDTITGKGVLDEGAISADADIFALQLTTRTSKETAADGSKEKHYHQWVLLLRKMDGYAEVFARVGAGLVVNKVPPPVELPSTRVYLR